LRGLRPVLTTRWVSNPISKQSSTPSSETWKLVQSNLLVIGQRRFNEVFDRERRVIVNPGENVAHRSEPVEDDVDEAGAPDQDDASGGNDAMEADSADDDSGDYAGDEVGEGDNVGDVAHRSEPGEDNVDEAGAPDKDDASGGNDAMEADVADDDGGNYAGDEVGEGDNVGDVAHRSEPGEDDVDEAGPPDQDNASGAMEADDGGDADSKRKGIPLKDRVVALLKNFASECKKAQDVKMSKTYDRMLENFDIPVLPSDDDLNYDNLNHDELVLCHATLKVLTRRLTVDPKGKGKQKIAPTQQPKPSSTASTSSSSTPTPSASSSSTPTLSTSSSSTPTPSTSASSTPTAPEKQSKPTSTSSTVPIPPPPKKHSKPTSKKHSKLTSTWRP